MLLAGFNDANEELQAALPSNQSYNDDYGGVNAEEAATSIGEEDLKEEKELNEDYDADDLEEQKDESIDTNPEGSKHPASKHGLVEEGPGPDA